MPRDNSQKNSGIVAMACMVDPRSVTSNMTAFADAMNRGPPMSPSIAMPRGTKPDRYIR